MSTDYDTSDRLYFEPLTVEDVLNVVEAERPEGIIVQFGGQTPLSLATRLEKALKDDPIPAASGNGNCRILGTPPDSIDAAEDRERWQAILDELDILQPPGGVARSEAEALVAANNIGYPVMVRPSFVLGGRAMEIVGSDSDLKRYITTAVEVDPEKPVLVDKYLANATELDVDALCDAEGNVVIAGIMEHIEQAGVHSGDSACSIPSQTIPEKSLETIQRLDAEGREAPRRRRPHQHSVRGDPRRHRLHHRGEPARVPHRAFRRQGDRPPAGQVRVARHGRVHAEGH